LGQEDNPYKKDDYLAFTITQEYSGLWGHRPGMRRMRKISDIDAEASNYYGEHLIKVSKNKYCAQGLGNKPMTINQIKKSLQ
jgi:hypothetical protein